MSEAHDKAEPSWLRLSDVATRLGLYIDGHQVLAPILKRGKVRVRALRSDVHDVLPERVKRLLKAAEKLSVSTENDEIIASFHFQSEQEADQVLGSLSDWRYLDPDGSLRSLYRGRELHGDFRFLRVRLMQVQVDWSDLQCERRRLGWQPTEPASFAPDEPAIGQTKAPPQECPRTKAKPGPKAGTVNRYAEADRNLFPEIERLMRDENLSCHAAATRLANENKVGGSGTNESLARRLAGRFRSEHPS